MAEEIVKRNEVRIAGKPVGDYVKEIIDLFGKGINNIILSTSEAYKEKTINIIDSFAGFGININKDYKNGNVNRWVTKEQTAINKNTGRRELRTFFTIGIYKSPNLYMYTDQERNIKVGGTNFLDEIKDIDERRDVLRISDRMTGDYLWAGMCLFRRYDEILITCPKIYQEKTKDIIKDLNKIGVRINKNYVKNNLAEWKIYKVNVINEKTGKNEDKTFFVFGLIKDPNTYMYTDEERIVDIE